jgi:PAS domain S-box-containing protein
MPGVHGLTAVLAVVGLLALGMAIGFALTRRRPRADPAVPPKGAGVSSEEKFRAVLEESAAAVFVIDDGRVRYANQAAAALTGVAPADLVERAFLDRFHPDSHDIVRHRVLKAPSPAVAGLRYEARLTGNDDRWVELTGRALDFGGQATSLVTAFDVTERRRAEEAMRESERRMRDILETVQLVAVLLDREGVMRIATLLPGWSGTRRRT